MLKALIKTILLISSISLNSLAGTSNFRDVTSNWTFRGEVVSAFAETINKIEKRENFLIMKVFEGKDLDGQKLRFELFYTGNDAEYYPQFYIITNARIRGEATSSFKGRAFYILDFSSPDLELGDIPPKFDPFEMSNNEIVNYIQTQFLAKDLTVLQ